MRIREVAEGLGYRPNPVARLLTQRRTMTLGVLTPQSLAVIFSNPFFALFSEGVAHAAEDADTSSTSSRPSTARLRRRSADPRWTAWWPSGCHPTIRRSGQIRGAGLPMVLVDSDDLPEHSSVVVDDEAGARAAAEHLLVARPPRRARPRRRRTRQPARSAGERRKASRRDACAAIVPRSRRPASSLARRAPWSPAAPRSRAAPRRSTAPGPRASGRRPSSR